MLFIVTDLCLKSATPFVVSSTTELTTPPCVDKTPDVCAQAIQNSVSYCYTNEEDCCATCRDKKKSNLLDECAWGDKVV